MHRCHPLENEYTDSVNLLESGLTTEEAVIKLKLSKPIPTRIEKHHYLQQKGKQELTSSFEEFLRLFNKKDVVPTLKAMQKMIAFWNDTTIDMLKLGCTLPNLANICLQKSTDAKFYTVTEGDEDLLENIQAESSVVHLSFSHAKQLLRKFCSKVYKHFRSFFKIDANQLYLYFKGQTLLTVSYTHWDIDSETSRLTPQQNKTRSSENMVMSYFQRTRPDCKVESLYSTCRQKQIDRPSFTEEDIKRGSKNREFDNLRRSYIQEERFTLIETWECE